MGKPGLKNKNWRILVLENQADNLRLVSKTLANQYGDVHVVNTNAQALDVARKTELDIIIVNLDVPNTAGWQLLEALRKDALTGGLKIIATTSFHTQQVAENAIRAGFDACIQTPLVPALFISQLANIMGQDN